MPSHAVLRKKARRESKRRKLKGEGEVGGADQPPLEDKRPKDEPREAVARKRPRPATEPAGDAAGDAVAAAFGGATRRERLRREAQRRFERQLARVNGAVERTGGTAGTERDDKDGEGTSAAATTRSETLRHDPKFKNGTFWRTRKERRGRTVFLGNMPARFTENDVSIFVNSVLDAYRVSSNNDASLDDDDDAVKKTNSEEEIVDSVDFLPAKPRAKHRHLFLTLQSKKLAEHAVKVLDSYRLDGALLRCNFASDKTQRSEAIRRRSSASSHA